MKIRQAKMKIGNFSVIQNITTNKWRSLIEISNLQSPPHSRIGITFETQEMYNFFYINKENWN